MNPKEIVVGLADLRSKIPATKAKANTSSRRNTATKSVLTRKRENLGKKIMEEVKHVASST
eukprot:scaffold6274_cov78-Skeletonema_dohrnii-CCMP3373.AAC.1